MNCFTCKTNVLIKILSHFPPSFPSFNAMAPLALSLCVCACMCVRVCIRAENLVLDNTLGALPWEELFLLLSAILRLHIVLWLQVEPYKIPPFLCLHAYSCRSYSSLL